MNKLKNIFIEILGSQTKTAFSKFVLLGFSGTLLSLIILLAFDFLHPNFCVDIPNIHFWKCTNSLMVHMVFLILFPFAYLAYAIFYSQKYLLFLFIELIIQKAKYESIEWVLQYIPSSMDTMLKKISKRLGLQNSISTKELLEHLLALPFNKITEKFMPNLFFYYLIISLEITVFVYLWLKM